MRVVSAAIVCVILLVTLLHLTKPLLLYTESGRVRDFGVGWRKKTVVPLWLAVIILAILSYAACYVYLEDGDAPAPTTLTRAPRWRA